MRDLFSTLSAIAGRFTESEAGREVLVPASWRRAAGPVLSGRTKPIRLKHRVLEIAVADRMWQRQLGEHAPEILSKLNAVLGGSYVDRLQFVIDPERLPDTEQSISHADVDVSQLPQATAFAAERIVDPDLRLQFLRAAAASQASDLRTR